MIDNTSQKTIQKQAKIVGFTYLLTTLIGFVNNFWIKPGLHKTETLLQSEVQFRIAEFLDMLMFVLVMWMAVALYLVTKNIHKNRALLGLVFRTAEVVLGFVILFINFAPLTILKKADKYNFNHIELDSLATLFFDISNIGWNLHLILMSIGAIIFMSLLLSASYIPKWLGYWALFTYIIVLLGFGLQILLPEFPKNLMIVMAPGAMFELIFGIWLLVKGVKLKQV
ncbi:DUF4386 domain-containing protein [Muricauda sp. 2012CJ35-5]|uniref:DUF4386 domain-containing protein n=1 Tax=Flagellimonas spongiicola TaxID=2942208 RepID=A0ABT0PP57_9FLAO|nr:DUF4386 domain-containing protein [Allomuricauda spongiicola]MCL6273175.1 DUF4386 domain-containing protein [Allomuricauda spongiicola]